MGLEHCHKGSRVVLGCSYVVFTRVGRGLGLVQGVLPYVEKLTGNKIMEMLQSQ